MANIITIQPRDISLGHEYSSKPRASVPRSRRISLQHLDTRDETTTLPDVRKSVIFQDEGQKICTKGHSITAQASQSLIHSKDNKWSRCPDCSSTRRRRSSNVHVPESPKELQLSSTMPYRSSSSRSSRGELRMVRRSDNTISYGRSRRDSLATERYSVRVDLPRIPNVFTPLKSLLYSEPRVVVKPERSYTDYPTRRYCYARSEMPTYSSKTASSSQRPVTIHGYRRPSVLLS